MPDKENLGCYRPRKGRKKDLSSESELLEFSEEYVNLCEGLENRTCGIDYIYSNSGDYASLNDDLSSNENLDTEATVFISNAGWTIYRDNIIRDLYNKINDLDLKIFTSKSIIKEVLSDLNLNILSETQKEYIITYIQAIFYFITESLSVRSLVKKYNIPLSVFKKIKSALNLMGIPSEEFPPIRDAIIQDIENKLTSLKLDDFTEESVINIVLPILNLNNFSEQQKALAETYIRARFLMLTNLNLSTLAIAEEYDISIDNLKIIKNALNLTGIATKEFPPIRDAIIQDIENKLTSLKLDYFTKDSIIIEVTPFLNLDELSETQRILAETYIKARFLMLINPNMSTLALVEEYDISIGIFKTIKNNLGLTGIPTIQWSDFKSSIILIIAKELNRMILRNFTVDSIIIKVIPVLELDELSETQKILISRYIKTIFYMFTHERFSTIILCKTTKIRDYDYYQILHILEKHRLYKRPSLIKNAKSISFNHRLEKLHDKGEIAEVLNSFLISIKDFNYPFEAFIDPDLRASNLKLIGTPQFRANVDEIENYFTSKKVLIQLQKTSNIILYADEIYQSHIERYSQIPYHFPVQSKFLENFYYIIAVEVTVWKFLGSEIINEEEKLVVQTGHIDFLGIVDNHILIFDYKQTKSEILQSIPQFFCYANLLNSCLTYINKNLNYDIHCIGFTHKEAYRFEYNKMSSALLQYTKDRLYLKGMKKNTSLYEDLVNFLNFF